MEAGQNHSFALKTNGTLWAWGYNVYGALGDGTTTNRSSPLQVGSGTTWKAAEGGWVQTIATKTDGTLWAWGYNDDGWLGDNKITSKSSPIQIGAFTTWSKIAVRGGHNLTIVE